MLTFHHLGLLVEKISFSVQHYSELFGTENISKVYRIDSQKVNVCFVKIGNDSYLELVEPLGEDSPVFRLLKKRMSYYHIGYKVSNIIATISKLESMNYKTLEVFDSEAFDGKKCVFLFTPEAHLIELIEI